MSLSKSVPDDTRAKIIEAALDLFSDKGFHATTTRKIAQKAGISEVTLFRHFKTKMALFNDVLQELNQLGFSTKKILDDLNQPIAPKIAIRMAVETTFNIIEKNPREVRLLLYALLDRVEGFEENYVATRRNVGLEFIADAFRRLQEEKQITSRENPHLLAHMILSQTYEMVVQWVLIPSSPLRKYDRETLINSILNLFLT